MQLIPLIAASLLITVIVPKVSASSGRTPYKHVVSNCEYFFVMLPIRFEKQDGELVPSKSPRGTAYQVTETGQFRKLWTVEGWYAFPGEVFLSADGETLIRIREPSFWIFSNEEDSNIDASFITFWRKGHLLKEYFAKDLISDVQKGIRIETSSGARWLDRDKLTPVISSSELYWIDESFENGATVRHHPEVFQLVTLEGNLILFDLKSGRILMNEHYGDDQSEPENLIVDPFADETSGN